MAKKKAKLTYVQGLFDEINGGTDAGATLAAAEAQVLLEEFVRLTRNVIKNWEKGDLANAVNGLEELADRAEGK